MASVQSDMNQVVVRMLEDWGMMMVEPNQDLQVPFDDSQPFYLGRLRFHGIVSGTYAVICQEAFAQALAGNLLGELDGAKESQLLDAISEMTNVISGNLLTSTYGDETVFDLTSPTAEIVSSAEVKNILKSFYLGYLADGEPVVVTFMPEDVECL